MGFRHYLTRRKRERELDEELRVHREMSEEDFRRAGMEETDARFAAQRALGNVTSALEDSRAVWNFQWLESLMQDARYAVRSFLRAPAFALTVIGTIGLALGLNTTLFTIFNAYVLRPLAVRDPYSLSQFNWISKGGDFHALSRPEFEKLRRENPVFTDVVASAGTVTRSGGRHLLVSQVSTNSFSMLGIDASIGRPLLPGDSGVAVLSDEAWKNKFGGDAQILGQKLEVLGGTFEIVGVGRPEFTGLQDSPPDAWIVEPWGGFYTAGVWSRRTSWRRVPDTKPG